MCVISTPVGVIIDLHHGSGSIHIWWFKFWCFGAEKRITSTKSSSSHNVNKYQQNRFNFQELLYLLVTWCSWYQVPKHHKVDVNYMILRCDIPDMHLPACIIMIVAYTLAPIVRQSISNHHADFSVFMMSCELYEAIRITLQLSINYDRRRLEDGKPISSFLLASSTSHTESD